MSLKPSCRFLLNSLIKSVFCLTVLSILYTGSLYFNSSDKRSSIFLTASFFLFPTNLSVNGGVSSFASLSALSFNSLSVVTLDVLVSSLASSALSNLNLESGTFKSETNLLALCIPLLAIKLGNVPLAGSH